MSVCENGMWFFGSVVFMFFLNWRLTLVLLTVSPFVAVLAFIFSKKMRLAHRAMREQNAVLNTRTQENISRRACGQGFAREDYEIEQFIATIRRLPASDGLCAPLVRVFSRRWILLRASVRRLC
jgi:ATP-binding cassette subfamily B protein